MNGKKKAKVFHEKIDANGNITHKTSTGVILAAKVQAPKGKKQRRGF